MFVPGAEVVVAMEDSKSTTTIFKEFKSSDPNDKFELVTMSIGKRNLQLIQSGHLYTMLYEYLNLQVDEYLVENVKHLISNNGKIKLYYATPKEILNLMPSSNISMTLYNKTYCLMFLSNTNDIIILLQAITPITALDENLFTIILDYILKGCIRYVFSTKEVLNEHLHNDDFITDFYQLTNQWYKEFITLIVDKYNMFKSKNKDDLKNKNVLIDELQKELINIIKQASYDKVIPSDQVLEFFKYRILKKSDILEKPTERKSDNDLITIKTVGYDNNTEMMSKYLSEIYKPMFTIFTNKVFQPETLMSNDEYSIVVDIIKQSYEKTIGNVIDVMHFIKYTIFQELYHYHIIAENYYTHKNTKDEILQSLCKGEIFKF